MPISRNIPQCQYVKTDGRRCGSPALKTKRWCFFHYEINRPTVTLDVPPLEDGNAVQLALTDLARAVADSRIELKPAALLAYILQTASANLKRVQLGVFPDRMVTDLPDLDPYSRGLSIEDPSAVEGQGFNPAENNGAPAPTTLPEARAQRQRSANPSVSSATSAVKASDSRPSASIRGKEVTQKIAAAKSGNPKAAKELLDLLQDVS